MDTEFDGYLVHHGIKGQKWGVRNAEWYPIDEYKRSKGRRIYEMAKSREPRITNDVKAAVSRTSGRMHGLEHRLKTEQSIVRKLHLGKEIQDAIRFTAISKDKDFVRNYQAIKDTLRDAGYTETRCKNYFSEYKLGKVKHKSVQSNFETPDGYTFEIQFQTPASQKVKDKKVPLYEESRNPKTSAARREELARAMEALAETIKDPEDIDKILSHGSSSDERPFFEGIGYLVHRNIKNQKWEETDG